MKKKQIITIVYILVLFLSFLSIQYLLNITERPYDTAQYSSIGDSLFLSGSYSINNICDDFRGYAFPSYIGFCNMVSEKIGFRNAYWWISSFVFSFLFFSFTVFYQGVFLEGEKNDSTIIRGWVPLILLIVFFYGLITYPLTDLYAALLCVLGAHLLFTATNYSVGLLRRYVLYFISGIVLYITYNIRTIYQLTLISAIVVIVFAGWEWKKSSNGPIINTIVLPVSFYVIGAAIASFPQVIINYHKYRIISPWINNRNLFVSQLFAGLQHSRYATYIGDANECAPGMIFTDQTGTIITNEWSALEWPLTIVSYIKMFFRYPIEYIAIFGKHIVNAIFILFPEQYIKDIHVNRSIYAIMSIIAFLLIVIALLMIYHNKRLNSIEIKGKEKIKTLIMFSVLLPSIAILFGQSEERFMVLPLLLGYSCISCVNFRDLTRYLTKKRRTVFIVCLVIFAAMLLAIESEILGSFVEFPICFHMDNY